CLHECSGDHDLQVPQLSTQAWIRSLNFSIGDDWRAWHLDGQAAGLSHLTPFFALQHMQNKIFVTHIFSF
uniref:Uncharacterized protein n=1 Tax=Aegilops tauschii subsp. strangulata TaxID=200361 RepID=A0A453HA76_AEGTS